MIFVQCNVNKKIKLSLIIIIISYNRLTGGVRHLTMVTCCFPKVHKNIFETYIFEQHKIIRYAFRHLIRQLNIISDELFTKLASYLSLLSLLNLFLKCFSFCFICFVAELVEFYSI